MRLRLKRERHEDATAPNRVTTRRRAMDLNNDQHDQDDRQLRFSAEDWLELADLLGKAVEEEAQASPQPARCSSEVDAPRGVAVLAA